MILYFIGMILSIGLMYGAFLADSYDRFLPELWEKYWLDKARIDSFEITLIFSLIWPLGIILMFILTERMKFGWKLYYKINLKEEE